MSTIALAIICKNERHNLPRLLASVEGCFDEIHITDTGSTDGTIEYLKTQPVQLHHFKWVDDFSEARNYAFSHAKTDYTMWLDCDDVLHTKEEFISFKDSILPTANYWVATYHYAQDDKGNPACSFMRERIIKNGMGFKWQHFIHEGIAPAADLPVKIAYATSWDVRHMRSQEDIKQDKNRNLSIFEKNQDKINSRLKYYYGKELFEAQRPLEAFNQLIEASKLPDLEFHDRILAIQYAAMSAMQCNQFAECIKIASLGLQLSPNRAEFYAVIGDSYLKLNQYDNAIPSFVAATHCINTSSPTQTFAGSIFTQGQVYTHYPRNQLARIYFQKGDMAKAKKWLEEAMSLGHDAETGILYSEILKVEKEFSIKSSHLVKKVDEIVISSPLITPYEWDEDVMVSRGVGGSETAAILMANNLAKFTNMPVKIFMERKERLDKGLVSYIPNAETRKYFADYEPRMHIAWRHNYKLTNAPTFVWCHDLGTQEIDKSESYDKVLALSTFHKNYIHHTFKVPMDKIHVTRNGIDLSRFQGRDFSKKNKFKVVFSSSPDRGMERAIKIVKRAREISNDPYELHCFYGFDNLLKMGGHADVARMQKAVDENPFVKFHGNVSQSELVTQLQDAKTWLYPTDFLETYCITALEMVSCRVRPVVRSYGALPYTLKDLPSYVYDRDCVTQDDIDAWALLLIAQSEIEQPAVDMTPYSWESVARDWVRDLLDVK